LRPLLAALLSFAAALAQTPCRSTPVYEPCDIDFELTEPEAAQHPNPYLSVEVRAEFRAPKGQTYRLPGFWDGGRKLKIRFSPLVEGQWDFRVTSNIDRFNGQTGSFTASTSRTPGFVLPFNVHHFRYSKPDTAHFWMGFSCLNFAALSQESFRALVDTRAKQRFNHMTGFVLGEDAKGLANPDQPVPERFQAVDERVRYLNEKGITWDILLAGGNGQLESLLPNWKQRERFLRYVVARYAAFNITWQGVQSFETYRNGPALLKEIGQFLQQADPYRHPRSTHAVYTSASLSGDGWLNYRVYQAAEPSVYAVEQQLYATPAVNNGYGGAGFVDDETFRRRIWNAALSGQHVGLPDLPANDPKAQYLAHLYSFFQQTRYWDLEPYFRVEGGRALALEEVEYIVYQDKAVPIDLIVHKAGYDLSWYNPATGEWLHDKKGFKGERYTSDGPPDKGRDWVLYIRREGKKQGMLRSYKLESRTVVLQPPETSKTEVPFEIQLPQETVIKAGEVLEFNATLRKTNRATRNTLWLWTAEVPASGLGYRVLATTQFGRFVVPPDIAREFPATLAVRVTGIDGNGKLYATDRVYTLQK
jgi:hypothetical protein